MIIKQAILKLHTDTPLAGHGNSLRGYIANQFPQFDMLHNHNKDETLLYLYPRIQYRIIDGIAYLIGIDEGVPLIRLIEEKINSITLKDHDYTIKKKELVSEDSQFGISESLINYCFINPWLALNEKNYHEYMKMGSQRKRYSILRDILKGNLLSLSKSLGYVVDEQIKVATLLLEENECSLKGTPMLGFLGTFSVNFEIPDYWGIGKSVSRGFGTVKQVTEKA
ncbi:MAG: hypothetical protein FJ240_08415 [Nitrospira sp.]|nr:hypothetical protein [Nitrospira sp.]